MHPNFSIVAGVQCSRSFKATLRIFQNPCSEDDYGRECFLILVVLILHTCPVSLANYFSACLGFASYKTNSSRNQRRDPVFRRSPTRCSQGIKSTIKPVSYNNAIINNTFSSSYISDGPVVLGNDY